MGLTRAQLDRAYARQLRGGHGQQVALGAHVENEIEDALRNLSNVNSYEPGNEMHGACDHVITLRRAPDVSLTIESKIGTHEPYGSSHAKRKPNGRVKLLVCKARLKGLARLYPFNAFRVATTAFLRDGAWCIKGALTSKLPASDIHPDRVQPSQTIVLDDVASPWKDLESVLEEALDQALVERFRQRASAWFEKARTQS